MQCQLFRTAKKKLGLTYVSWTINWDIFFNARVKSKQKKSLKIAAFKLTYSSVSEYYKSLIYYVFFIRKKTYLLSGGMGQPTSAGKGFLFLKLRLGLVFDCDPAQPATRVNGQNQYCRSRSWIRPLKKSSYGLKYEYIYFKALMFSTSFKCLKKKFKIQLLNFVDWTTG